MYLDSRGVTKNSYGYTLFEMLATLLLFALVSSMAVSNLKEYEDPLTNASAELVSFFKTTRQRAIASTSAYTVSASSDSSVVVAYAASCSDESPTLDPQLSLEFPSGVIMTETDWIVCFNTRGLADANPEIELLNNQGQTKTVKVYLGGGVRVL